MSIPLLPESAPFSGEQRAWLNGFFAGLLGLDNSATVAAPTASTQQNATQPVAAQAPVEKAEEFPWHDANLALEERMQLAQGKPFERQLMAAMAQLDCGTCGYNCQMYAEAIAGGHDKDISKCTPGGNETRKKLKQLLAERPANETSTQLQPAHIERDALKRNAAVAKELETSAPLAAYDRLNPFPAGILEIAPLTRKDSEKDVRFVSLDLCGSGLHYEVGDALGVYPENCPELVESLLEVLEITGEEPVATPENCVVPVRIALSKAYVINSCSDDFVATLARLAADPNESSRLAALARDDHEGFLDGRDIFDLLMLFPSARPQGRAELSELVSALAPLRPRLYSISSSLKAHPDQVHLTVAAVRYSLDGCNRVRKGAASTFLTERIRPGHKVGVFVQEAHAFRPPCEGDTPMIMVGPGTGVAPFRAFLQERAATNARGKNWLLFGDQRHDCDFLYRHELEDYSRSGLLTRLDTAFSRDQEKKIYVQHRMQENGAELWRWLEAGAHFYVCGDAQRMARDVDATLHAIVAEHGQMSEAAAKSYIADLTRTQRYQRDVY
ncbi:MAG TPA: sulfite reductase subunit alpha [Abditibacteriaceae bacterium]|jgi:sulfite reductase (NADPH) flavoprotein alpha-component